MTVNDILQDILTRRPLKWKGKYKSIHDLIFEEEIFKDVDFLQYYAKDMNFQYLCNNYETLSLRRYKQKLLRLSILHDRMMKTITDMLKEMYPSYIAQMITTVAPMTMPTGNIFTLKPIYIPGVTV